MYARIDEELICIATAVGGRRKSGERKGGKRSLAIVEKLYG